MVYYSKFHIAKTNNKTMCGIKLVSNDSKWSKKELDKLIIDDPGLTKFICKTCLKKEKQNELH